MPYFHRLPFFESSSSMATPPPFSPPSLPRCHASQSCKHLWMASSYCTYLRDSPRFFCSWNPCHLISKKKPALDKKKTTSRIYNGCTPVPIPSPIPIPIPQKKREKETLHWVFFKGFIPQIGFGTPRGSAFGGSPHVFGSFCGIISHRHIVKDT